MATTDVLCLDSMCICGYYRCTLFGFHEHLLYLWLLQMYFVWIPCGYYRCTLFGFHEHLLYLWLLQMYFVWIPCGYYRCTLFGFHVATTDVLCLDSMWLLLYLFGFHVATTDVLCLDSMWLLQMYFVWIPCGYYRCTLFGFHEHLLYLWLLQMYFVWIP